MKINKKSWHYHIAKTYTMFDPYDRKDICSYTRSVIHGVVNIICIIAMTALVSYSMFVLPIIWSITGFDSSIKQDGFFVLGFVLWSATLAAFILAGISLFLENREKQPDNFIKKAYSSWKNKFCLKIDYD